MEQRNPREAPLARFEIEQYEVHVGKYEVEARSEAEAIQRLFNGDGDMLNGSEYIGSCESEGMTADAGFARQLAEVGVKLRDSIVPSIRSVRRVEKDARNA